MKQLILPFLFLFLACTGTTNQKHTHVIHFDSGFSLYQDTISIDVKGRMTHALRYHDKYYVLFEQQLLNFGGYGKRWLCILSDGQVERTIDCPEKMETVYLDFYVENDTIILKPYMHEDYYYLDMQNYTWKDLANTDDLIFEDENYRVYSLNFGEYGGKTWFKDKKTGEEYVTESKIPLVNKIDTTYYLTNPFFVLKIENPQALNKCDDGVTYENIEKRGKYVSWYGEPIGFEELCVNRDTVRFGDFFSIGFKEINILSSFVWQNELLHIYKTDSATYIARVKNNSIETIQEIGEGLSFYNGYESYRCRNMNGNELLKFRTKDEKLLGLMEVIDNNVHICYLANKAELKPVSVGTDKANEIFVEHLQYILANWEHLKIEDVAKAEQKWNTFDITPNHVVGISDYKIDVFKAYRVQEDSIISNDFMYYATQSPDLIKVVMVEWEETDLHRRAFEGTDVGKLVKETFQNKLKFLEDCITKKVGTPIQDESIKGDTNKTWETANNLKIRLRKDKVYNRISLEISELRNR